MRYLKEKAKEKAKKLIEDRVNQLKTIFDEEVSHLRNGFFEMKEQLAISEARISEMSARLTE